MFIFIIFKNQQQYYFFDLQCCHLFGAIQTEGVIWKKNTLYDCMKDKIVQSRICPARLRREPMRDMFTVHAWSRICPCMPPCTLSTLVQNHHQDLAPGNTFHYIKYIFLYSFKLIKILRIVRFFELSPLHNVYASVWLPQVYTLHLNQFPISFFREWGILESKFWPTDRNWGL